jgi:hypothetical protein
VDFVTIAEISPVCTTKYTTRTVVVIILFDQELHQLNSVRAFQVLCIDILLSWFSFVLRIPSILTRLSLLEIRVIAKWNPIKGANNPAAKAART